VYDIRYITFTIAI